MKYLFRYLCTPEKKAWNLKLISKPKKGKRIGSSVG